MLVRVENVTPALENPTCDARHQSGLVRTVEERNERSWSEHGKRVRPRATTIRQGSRHGGLASVRGLLDNIHISAIALDRLNPDGLLLQRLDAHHRRLRACNRG